MAIAAGHVLVGDQSVEDGLLGPLHDGGVERVEETPGDESQLVILAFGTMAEGGDTGGDPAWIGGGEGQEKVTGEVGASGDSAG